MRVVNQVLIDTFFLELSYYLQNRNLHCITGWVLSPVPHWLVQERHLHQEQHWPLQYIHTGSKCVYFFNFEHFKKTKRYGSKSKQKRWQLFSYLTVMHFLFHTGAPQCIMVGSISIILNPILHLQPEWNLTLATCAPLPAILLSEQWAPPSRRWRPTRPPATSPPYSPPW